MAPLSSTTQSDAKGAPLSTMVHPVTHAIANQMGNLMRNGIVKQMVPAFVHHHVSIEAERVFTALTHASPSSSSTAQVELDGDWRDFDTELRFDFGNQSFDFGFNFGFSRGKAHNFLGL
jgi:hypothetical protein